MKFWQGALGVTVFVVFVCVFSYALGTRLADNEERDFRELCQKLDADYVSEPRMMCVRDREVVYP